MAVGSIQPPIQRIREALYLGAKQPGHEADHSPPFGTGVKERVELYFHSPNTPSKRGAQLKKHRDDFTLPPMGNGKSFPVKLNDRRNDVSYAFC
jgi:hypothetical protein